MGLKLRLPWHRTANPTAAGLPSGPQPGAVYNGRMASVDGSLVADEGPDRGAPVRYDQASGGFVYVGPGEPSHFDLYHQRYATVDLEPPA